MRQRRWAFNPPYELLERIRHFDFPIDFHGDDEIADVFLLSSSKLIEATIPEVSHCRRVRCYDGYATVLGLTPLGRDLAERYAHMRESATNAAASAP